jgi:ribosomal protein S18 acetylase RimI-like enzyme
MQIRPATPADVTMLGEIDATIESNDYLFVDRAGEGLARSWRVEQRPLRERLIRQLPLTDDTLFVAKQIATGIDDGLAMVAEHDGQLVALMVAQPDLSRRTLRVLDLRVDFDLRRQGLASALLFAAINHARATALRAVSAESVTDNFPAAALLAKSGFELAGIDERRNTNHDLVKEAVTLFWYAALD